MASKKKWNSWEEITIQSLQAIFSHIENKEDQKDVINDWVILCQSYYMTPPKKSQDFESSLEP